MPAALSASMLRAIWAGVGAGAGEVGHHREAHVARAHFGDVDRPL
jgi:hypothetical protein